MLPAARKSNFLANPAISLQRHAAQKLFLKFLVLSIILPRVPLLVEGIKRNPIVVTLRLAVRLIKIAVGGLVALKPEMSAFSVVCVGAFNPPILTPDWLERHELIGRDDASDARQASNFLISPQVAQFETNWFAIQVVEHQFSLTSKGPLTGAFKDLAIGIFTLLPQTPITALGLNYLAHYKLSNAAEYHAIGDVLAPKPIWRKLFPEERLNIGMANLTVQIQEMDRKTSVPTSKDQKNITVQPSGVVKNNGVFLAYNDHRDIGQTSKLPAEVAAEIVERDWETTTQDAMRVFESLIAQSLAEASKEA